jgi:hypothetical protein
LKLPLLLLLLLDKMGAGAGLLTAAGLGVLAPITMGWGAVLQVHQTEK